MTEIDRDFVCDLREIPEFAETMSVMRPGRAEPLRAHELENRIGCGLEIGGSSLQSDSCR